MISYLDACQQLADKLGITRRELLTTYRRAEITEMLRAELGIALMGTQTVPSEILEAGDVIAGDRGIPRAEVFLSMRTAEVLAQAYELTGDFRYQNAIALLPTPD